MFFSGDPKTTAAGILLIVIGLLSLIFGVGPLQLIEAVQGLNLAPLFQVLLPILTGTGLLAASDNKKDKL